MLNIRGSIPSRPQKAPISRSFFGFKTISQIPLEKGNRFLTSNFCLYETMKRLAMATASSPDNASSYASVEASMLKGAVLPSVVTSTPPWVTFSSPLSLLFFLYLYDGPAYLYGN